MDCEYDYCSDSDDKAAPQHHNAHVKQGPYSFYKTLTTAKVTLVVNTPCEQCKCLKNTLDYKNSTA